jgi:hypothetical protein
MASCLRSWSGRSSDDDVDTVPMLKLKTCPCPKRTERRASGGRDEYRVPLAHCKTVLGEGARTDPLAIGAFPRCVVGRDRETVPAFAPDQRTLVECTDDLRRLGVDQARGAQALVRVVLSGCRASWWRAAVPARRCRPVGAARP